MEKPSINMPSRGWQMFLKPILNNNNLSGDDVTLFIPHQANRRIIDATAKRCDIDPNKVIINIGKFGNTTAGTIPIALNEVVENKILKMVIYCYCPLLEQVLLGVVS